jgi:glycerol-3-phosphate dehydrogenase
LNRQQFLQLADSETFDICIIGGGATGAGCALDAQSRGLKTILVEAEDFGGATSSKSTKLIHGGVRYLEQAVKKLSIGQFKMVRKALKERKTLLRIAPFITRPLQLITPCRTWLEGLYYFIGLKLYDWISGRTNIGKSQLLNRYEAIKKISTLRKKELYYAVLYYDGQLDDQRFNFALIQTATSLGAVCINHCQVNSFIKNNKQKLQAITVTDRISGQNHTIKAKIFINATGPFSDAVRLIANPNLGLRIRVSKGVHILLPMRMMPSTSALLIPQTRDGRLIFAIPYQGNLLVGTTDDETNLTAQEFGPNAAEVQYLLDYVNQYLDVNAQPNDVLAGFGGLRPLIMAQSGNTKDLVRDHEVEIDQSTGLLSVLGGKWTTYRLMAKDAVDAATAELGCKTICTTEHIQLVGSKHFSEISIENWQQSSGWDVDVLQHLLSKYGDNALQIVQSSLNDIGLKKRLLPHMPYTLAELQYVLQNEMACTVKDVLCRRWGIQLANWEQTLQLIPIVGQIMGNFFGWDDEQKRLYLDGYKQEMMAMMEAIQSPERSANLTAS